MYKILNNTRNQNGYSVETLQELEFGNQTQYFRFDCFHSHNKTSNITINTINSEIIGQISVSQWVQLRKERVIDKISSLCTNRKYIISIGNAEMNEIDHTSISNNSFQIEQYTDHLVCRRHLNWPYDFVKCLSAKEFFDKNRTKRMLNRWSCTTLTAIKGIF